MEGVYRSPSRIHMGEEGAFAGSEVALSSAAEGEGGWGRLVAGIEGLAGVLGLCTGGPRPPAAQSDLLGWYPPLATG